MLIDKLHSVESAFAGTKEKDDLTKWERPSMAGPDRCMRSIVMGANGTVPEPWSGRFLNLLDNGIWEEEMVLDRLSRAGVTVCDRQHEVPTMLGKGHIDAIVECPDGKRRILEIKSRSEFVWRREIEQPSRDALTQIAAYIEAAYRRGWISWPGGILIGSNRGTAQAYEYEVLYDPQGDKLTWTITTTRGDQPVKGVYENVIGSEKKRREEIRKHLADGTLPTRPFVFGTDFPCGYCRFEVDCWKGYKDERGAAATDAKLEELDPTLLPMVSQYKAMRADEKIAKAEADRLGTQIKESLVRLNVKSGRIGEDYKVTLRLQDRKGYTVEPSTSEVLDIREAKS